MKKFIPVLLFFASCESPIPNCYERKSINTAMSDRFMLVEVNFDQVTTVINKYCAGCHGDGSANGNFKEQNTFDEHATKILQNSKNKHQNTNVSLSDQKIIEDYVLQLNDPQPENPTISQPTQPTQPTQTETPAVGQQTENVFNILKKNCTTCHSTQNPSGGVKLEIESDIRSHSEKIKEYIKNGHKGTKISDSDQKIVIDFLTSNQNTPTPQDQNPSTPQSSDATEFASVDPCTYDTTKKDENADAIANSPVLRANEVKVCHQKKLVFDRDKNSCHTATLSFDYKCDWEGVKKKFANVEEAKEKISELIEDKWLVDQCGEIDQVPYIFLLKFVELNGKTDIETKIITTEEL